MKFVRALVAAAAGVFCAALFLPSVSPAADKVVTVGFQKYGNLILLKGHGGLESRLAPLGFKVEWREFPSGPPLLEALNAGAIDFGQTGETPPISPQMCFQLQPLSRLMSRIFSVRCSRFWC